MKITSYIIGVGVSLSMLILISCEESSEISPADGNMTDEKVEVMVDEWCTHNLENNPDLPAVKERCAN